MKFLFATGLFCRFILASHLENNENDFNEEKSIIERLPYGPVNEIMSHLDGTDNEHFSKTSKEFFKYDPREVVLNLPLQSRKEPTQFVCEHLKKRKKLLINLKYHRDEIIIFDTNSLGMEYMKCLSGIEELRFGDFALESKHFVDSNFNLGGLFSKLRYLEFRASADTSMNFIPNDLKSLKLRYIYYSGGKVSIARENFKEKINQLNQLETLVFEISDLSNGVPVIFSPMVSELKKLRNFKRLSIEYTGNSHAIRNIVAQTADANYLLDLKSSIFDDFNVAGLFKNFSKATESVDIYVKSIDDTGNFCNTLTNLNHLKKLTLKIGGKNGNFDCLLESLPSSLNELFFDGGLKNYDLSRIILPKNLYSVKLYDVNSKLFEFLANHVEVLKGNVIDPKNILTIKKPFTKVKTLIFNEKSKGSIKLDVLLHLLDLLPNEMDSVYLTVFLDENDTDYFEEKVLSLKNRIKNLVFSPNHGDWFLTTKYVFDGTKMIRESFY